MKANYRIYDRTGGGVTEDIYAETLEDAITAGREWIEEGDWSGGLRDPDPGIVGWRRTIELECEVGEIIYDAAGEIDEDATDAAERHDCSGSYSDDEPDCPVDEGWDFVDTATAGLDDFGCRSHGGTAMTHYAVCRNTGIYRDTYGPGSQRNPDEPLEIVTYRERDEASETYIVHRHTDDDGYIPPWLAEYLDCSMSTRMTEEQAKEWIAGHSDDDVLDEGELEHAFAAIFGRRADDQARAEGLWSHLCA